jgi:hypothetical protein
VLEELVLCHRLWLITSLFGECFRVVETDECLSVEGLINDAMKAFLKGAEKDQRRDAEKIEDILRKRKLGDPVDSNGVGQEFEVTKHSDRLAKILDELLGFSYFQEKGWVGETATKHAFTRLNGKITDLEFEPRLLTHVQSGPNHKERYNFLMEGQAAVAQELNSYFRTCEHAAVHLPFHTLSGSTFMLSCMPFVDDAVYEEVFILRPKLSDERDTPARYKTSIRALAREMCQSVDKLPAVENIFSSLTEWCRSRRGLIVFASANILTAAGRKKKTTEQTVTVTDRAQSSKLVLRCLLGGLSHVYKPENANESRSPSVVFIAAEYASGLEIEDGKSRASPQGQLVQGIKDSLGEVAELEIEGRKLHQVLRARNPLEASSAGLTTFELFYKHWRTYCDRQNVAYFFENGTRLKTAYFWYGLHTNGTPWERSVKLRAAAASNMNCMGYSDGTSGIEHLFEHTIHHPDISSDVQDVYDQIALLKPDSLRALRCISAGKFWAHRQSLEKVYSKFEKRQLRKTFVAEELYRDRNYLGDALIRVTNEEKDNPRYRATLDVKAAVFSHWREEIKTQLQCGDTSGRDMWRTLFLSSADDIMNELSPETQRKEMPIVGQIDEDTQVWPEVFRKLIRSIEHDHDQLDKDRKKEALDQMDLATALSTLKGQTNPKDMMRVCFKHIFINRFRRGRMSGSAIFSRDDQADSIAAEMLQLISCDSEIGKPHAWLDEDLYPEYYAACENAMHAIGYVDVLDTMLEVSPSNNIRRLFFDADTHTSDEMHSRLADLRTHLRLGDKPIADLEWEDVQDCQDFLAVLYLTMMTGDDWRDVGPALSKYVGKDLHNPDVKPRETHRFAYIWDRPGTTECKLLAVRLFARYHERMADEKSDPREQDGHLIKAVGILNHGINRLSQLNFENERIRLVIARQRISRLRRSKDTVPPRERQDRLFLSEGRMNDVLRRAIDVGCAYDIYIELLIESACMLADDDRPIRAYCGYALPALRIIRSINYRGYWREGQACADRLFAKIEQLFENEGKEKMPDGSHRWGKFIDDAKAAQERLEEIFSTPVLRAATGEGSWGLGGHKQAQLVEEGTPVFGYLLPQVLNDIELQRRKPNKLH